MIRTLLLSFLPAPSPSREHPPTLNRYWYPLALRYGSRQTAAKISRVIHHDRNSGQEKRYILLPPRMLRKYSKELAPPQLPDRLTTQQSSAVGVFDTVFISCPMLYSKVVKNLFLSIGNVRTTEDLELQEFLDEISIPKYLLGRDFDLVFKTGPRVYSVRGSMNLGFRTCSTLLMLDS